MNNKRSTKRSTSPVRELSVTQQIINNHDSSIDDLRKKASVLFNEIINKYDVTLQHTKKQLKVKYEDLGKLIRAIYPVFSSESVRSKCVIAGGFASAYMNWNGRNAPSDCDIWFKRDSETALLEIKDKLIDMGWKYYRPMMKELLTPDLIMEIHEFAHSDHPITLQVLRVNTNNLDDVVNNFDFSVCKARFSFDIDEKGNTLGIRATNPSVLNDISKGFATYKPREEDYITKEPYTLNTSSLKRFERYTKKGYIICNDPDSKIGLNQVYQGITEMNKNSAESYVSNDNHFYGIMTDPANATLNELEMFLGTGYHFDHEMNLKVRDYRSKVDSVTSEINRYYWSWDFINTNPPPVKYQTRTFIEMKLLHEKRAREAMRLSVAYE